MPIAFLLTPLIVLIALTALPQVFAESKVAFPNIEIEGKRHPFVIVELPSSPTAEITYILNGKRFSAPRKDLPPNLQEAIKEMGNTAPEATPTPTPRPNRREIEEQEEQRLKAQNQIRSKIQTAESQFVVISTAEEALTSIPDEDLTIPQDEELQRLRSEKQTLRKKIETLRQELISHTLSEASR
jgi:hypothetical protein